jgi:hypothetical protein
MEPHLQPEAVCADNARIARAAVRVEIFFLYRQYFPVVKFAGGRAMPDPAGRRGQTSNKTTGQGR